MKPSLQFRLSQHLTLTPQLQQSIRLLQLSTVELNQEIDRLLMENPALEREDHEGGEAEAAPQATSSATPASEQPAERPAEQPAAASDVDWSAEPASNWRAGGDDEDSDRSLATPDTPTLRDHLRSQLTLTKLGALDEDGYLTQPLEEIVAMLSPEAEVDREFLLGELSIALQQLQNLEPVGVGARSPGECLCLQIKTLDRDAVRDLALVIAEKHLELLASRDYTRLKNATGADDDALRAAQRLILALNPRPGAAFAKICLLYTSPSPRD